MGEEGTKNLKRVMWNLFWESADRKIGESSFSELKEIAELAVGFIQDMDSDISFFKELTSSKNHRLESRLIDIIEERENFIQNYNLFLEEIQRDGIELSFQKIPES
jgi:hypothetical protein